MHIFKVAFYLTAIVYVLFCQLWLVYWFMSFVGIYCLISYFYPGAQHMSTRRKVVSATWDAPNDGLIYNNIKVRLNSLQELLDTYPP